MSVISRKELVALAVLAAASLSPLQAQDPPSLDGKWTAKFLAGNGMQTGAAVVFSGTEGTWRGFSAPRDNPCFGRETPLAVERTAPDAVMVKILFSKLMVGCPDGNFSVKLENGVLKGKLSTGQAIEMVRP